MSTILSKTEELSPTDDFMFPGVNDTAGTPVDRKLRLSTARNIYQIMRVTDSAAMNSDTTLTADDVLTFTPVINTNYVLECYLLIDSNAAADFKTDFSIPVGATGSVTRSLFDGSTVSLSTDLLTAAVLNDQAGAGNTWIAAVGHILVGATATPITVRWAQNLSTAYDTKILTGSFLRLSKSS